MYFYKSVLYSHLDSLHVSVVILLYKCVSYMTYVVIDTFGKCSAILTSELLLYMYMYTSLCTWDLYL
jgi:hypothetical protein